MNSTLNQDCVILYFQKKNKPALITKTRQTDFDFVMQMSLTC